MMHIVAQPKNHHQLKQVSLGLSQSPVRWSATHCLISCVIRASSLNALGGTWKCICLPNS